MFIRFSSLLSIAALAAVAAAVPGNEGYSGSNSLGSLAGFGSGNKGSSGGYGSSGSGVPSGNKGSNGGSSNGGSSGGSSGGECTTSPNNCCQSVGDASNPSVASALGLVNIAVDAITAQVGVSCTNIIGGQSCSAQPACCNGNTIESLVTLSCTPLNVGV